MKNSFLSEMISRGYMSQCTDSNNLDKITKEIPIKAYIGFDSTASSLHVGSLMQIMVLRLLQRHGHQPIVLLGGGTTLIGDPSGKDTTRKILKRKDINKNILSIKKLFEKLLQTKNKKTKPIFVDNYSWLGKLKYIDFLRDIGKHFTINKMLTFDSVKMRLEREQSLSYMEFNYMILQAYDFYELNQRYGCILQMGGSDQMGNIINGMELSRRKANAKVFGLTSPLLTTSDGKKMGKSQNGAVWLNKEMLSPFDFWQFWRNTSDADVGKFLKLYTEIDLIECEKLGSLKGSEINEAKSILANQVTKLCHGENVASDVEKTAKEVFEKGGVGSDLPSYSVSKNEVETGLSLAQLLTKTGLTKSGKEAKRLISENGARLNGSLISDTNQMLSVDDFNEPLKISAGKKRHAIVTLQK